MKKSVFTIAAGKEVYLEYACNLAMSFLYWNKETDIDFILITDLTAPVPAQIKERIRLIILPEGAIGEGFSSKLILDQFLTEGQSLFIDADCLIYGNLNPVFEAFKGNAVSVVGHTVTEGIDLGFCRDIASLRNTLRIPYFPIFCGSVYYFEKNELLEEFFNYMKTIFHRYDELGLIRLRGRENEEPLVAIAMSRFGFMPIPDDGQWKADRMFFHQNKKDILLGETHLWNNERIPSPEYSKLTVAHPLIIHYNNRFTENYEYTSDVMRLRLVILKRWKEAMANLYVSFLYEYPQAIYEGTQTQLKSLFRPLAHKILGVRVVKASNRI